VLGTGRTEKPRNSFKILEEICKAKTPLERLK
jgi:hypothetical protein